MVLNTAGTYRIEYADVLRAVGYYLDTHQFRDIALIETPDGFLVKGVVKQADVGTAQPVTYLLANADLEALIDEAQTRRGAGAAGDLGRRQRMVRYEDLLRVIGEQIDAEGWRDIVVMQTPSGTRLKAHTYEQTAGLTARVVDLLFSDDDVRQQLDTLRSRRKRDSGGGGSGRDDWATLAEPGVRLHHVIPISDLEPFYDQPGEYGSILEAHKHGLERISLIMTDTLPGGGPPLHRHTCEEVVIVPAGAQMRYHIEADTFEVLGPAIVHIAPGAAHAFINAGPERVSLVCIFADRSFWNGYSELGPNPLLGGG